jgi:hypothetical protein
MSENTGLRVWWIPQIPMEAFYVPVKSIDEAKLVLDVLARYDLFQFETDVKGDYSNAGGLEVWDGQEWWAWHDADGNDIDEVIYNETLAEEDDNA